MKTFNKLKEIRRGMRITRQELSDMLGIPFATLRQYELRYRTLPVEVAKKVGKILNINWWEIYEE